MELVEIFSDWPDQVECPKGKVLFNYGEVADYMYVVLEGEVELKVGDEPLAAEITGGIFGEMALVESRRVADAVTIQPSRLARINRDQFRSMIRDNPDIAIHLIAVLANRLRVAVAMTKL
jgi:CRP-like cAMP-binding protein